MAILKNIGCPGIFKYYCSEHSLHSRLQDTKKLQPPQSSPSVTHILMAKPSLGLQISSKLFLCLLNFADPLNVSHRFLCLSLPCPPLATVSFTGDTSIPYAPLPTTDCLNPDIQAPPGEPERLVLSTFLHPPKDVLLTIFFTV